MTATPRSRRGGLTPRMALSLRAPTDPQLSPDGTLIAYTVRGLGTRRGTWPLTPLVVSSADGRTSSEVPSTANVLSPRWAPDSTSLAFLGASLADRHQLFVAQPWDGE